MRDGRMPNLWSMARSETISTGMAATGLERAGGGEPYRPEYHDFMVAGGHRMAFVDAGQGRPVVCVHGNPTWSYFFRGVVNELRDSHRVIVPDHIGCGLSDKPDDEQYPYVLERRIDDLESLLDHLRLADPITLVVHDWGGMIGMGVAMRRLDRISRLVVMNTAAFGLPAGKRLPLRLRVLRDGGPLAELAVRGLNLFAWPATRLAVERPLLDSVRREYLRPYGSWRDRIATMRFVQDIPLSPGDRSFDAMRRIEAGLPLLAPLPMLVCWGMRDIVFDHHFLAEWRRRFPMATVYEFADAGHYLLEDAADRVIPLIRDFVAAPTGASRQHISGAACVSPQLI